MHGHKENFRFDQKQERKKFTGENQNVVGAFGKFLKSLGSLQ